MPSVALSKSAAQNLITQYKGIIDSNLNGENSIDLIISRLEAKVRNLEAIALSAYSALGFSGGNIASIEAQLKQKIAKLQAETAALNGINLQNCFLEALKQANSFELNLEQEYEQLKSMIISSSNKVLTESELATELLNEIAPAIDGTRIEINITSGIARVVSGGKKGTFTFNFNKSFSQLSKQAKAAVTNYFTNKKRNNRH